MRNSLQMVWVWNWTFTKNVSRMHLKSTVTWVVMLCGLERGWHLKEYAKQQSSPELHVSADFLLGYYLTLEMEALCSSKILCLSLYYTVLQPRKLYFSQPLRWELQIQHRIWPATNFVPQNQCNNSSWWNVGLKLLYIRSHASKDNSLGTM